MKSPLTMLVVEDRPNHMQDLTTMLEAELPRVPVQINVLYAEDLESALQLLPTADAVMTDVFFPAGDIDLSTMGEDSGLLCEEVRLDIYGSTNGQKPYGMVIVQEALTAGKPVVWITSTYHHGKGTNEASKWGRELGLEMFDSGSMYVDDTPHKPWKEALYGLLYLTLCVEEGHCVFVDGKMMGLEYYWSGSKQVRCLFDSVTHISRKLFSDDEFSGEYYPVLKKMVEMGFPRS